MDQNTQNKLYSIQSSLLYRNHGSKTCKSGPNYVWNIQKSHTPVSCQNPYTVKHILTECANLAPMTKIYYKTDNMNVGALLFFLKKINLYEKL